ncbi:MAG TPA: cytochrome c biogenesis protein CcdA [Candidatus Elarobacter sp.]
MIDVVDAALRAAGARSAAAVPLLFAAGAATSIGPCAAPRYVAVAALAHAARKPWTVIAAFACGLVAGYVALGLAIGTLGLGAGSLAVVQDRSPAVYALLAALLALAGIMTLLRAGAFAKSHSCGPAPRRGATCGGVFLLGASSVLVVSPCCTPILAGLAGLTMTTERAGGSATLLAAFACGHALPVVLIGAAGMRVAGVLRSVAASQASAIVAGGLMLALAAFYGTLA